MQPHLEKLEKFGPNRLVKIGEQNAFWKDTFQAYKTFFNKVKPTDSSEILSETLFFNDKINMNSILLRQKDWIKKMHAMLLTYVKKMDAF